MDWAPELGLQLSFAMDGRARALLLLVAVVAPAVAWWAITIREARRGTVLVLLATFVAAMSALLLAADVLTYVIAWEATSVLSYLLVGLHHHQPEARRAARTTIVVTGLGGIVLLAGLLLISAATGDTSFVAILGSEPDGPLVVAGAWLVLLAAMTKSAQFPLHGWLAGAGTAPTSASALLHAATLVVAGVDIILRLSPLTAQVPGWSAAACIIGLATFTWCTWVALKAKNAKHVLASTTSAQLGLALALASLGDPRAATAAVALLLVHGLYKSALFLLAGTAKAVTGDASLEAFRGLASASSGARWLIWLASLTLAGLPPLAGWVSKEAAVAVLLDASVLAAVPLVIGTALGVLVAARIVGVGLPARPKAGRPAPSACTALTVRGGPILAAPGGLILAAPGGLILAAVVLGLAPALLSGLVSPVGDPVVKLVLWPGLGLPVAVSLAGVALGMIAVRWRSTVGLTSAPPARPSAAATLDRLITDGLATAGQVTAAVHRLGRPLLVGIVPAMLFVTTLPLVLRAMPQRGLPLAASATEVVIVGVLLTGVAGAVLVPSRLGAVLALGLVGYALAGLFAVQGAPDLVLTQVIVETVVVVVFVAVLRRLPDTGPARAPSELDTADQTTMPSPAPRGAWVGSTARAMTATGVGLVAAVVVWISDGASRGRELAAVADAMAVPVGAGANVVNVVLTDFRALDTIGELSVLLLAALGILGLTVGVTLRSGPAAGQRGWMQSHLLVGAAPMVTSLSLVIGIHLLVVGHDQPGGGFAGGLVVAAGLAMHHLATGRLPRGGLLVQPAPLMAVGLLLVVGVAVAPLLIGGVAGDMGSAKVSLGLLGTPKITSALFLDIGVLLIVVGVVMSTLHLSASTEAEVSG